jgi:hypothetical protein
VHLVFFALKIGKPGKNSDEGSRFVAKDLFLLLRTQLSPRTIYRNIVLLAEGYQLSVLARSRISTPTFNSMFLDGFAMIRNAAITVYDQRLTKSITFRARTYRVIKREERWSLPLNSDALVAALVLQSKSIALTL